MKSKLLISLSLFGFTMACAKAAEPFKSPATETCIGSMGPQGPKGNDGTKVKFRVDMAMPEVCPNGGHSISVYLDNELDQFFTICNGLNNNEEHEGNEGAKDQSKKKKKNLTND